MKRLSTSIGRTGLLASCLVCGSIDNWDCSVKLRQPSCFEIFETKLSENFVFSSLTFVLTPLRNMFKSFQGAGLIMKFSILSAAALLASFATAAPRLRGIMLLLGELKLRRELLLRMCAILDMRARTTGHS